jgi:hypothetical protein
MGWFAGTELTEKATVVRRKEVQVFATKCAAALWVIAMYNREHSREGALCVSWKGVTRGFKLEFVLGQSVT